MVRANQPFDSGITIDPTVIPSFTGPDNHTGLFLDGDQVNSSVLIRTNDTNAVYIDKYQNFGINTLSPGAQLDINAADGSCIRLTYNGSSNTSALKVGSDGKMALSSTGGEITVDSSSDLNIKSHNGSTNGLKLNDTLIIATADQLNYTVVTPGTAATSKALVLDSNRDITNIRNLIASQLTGTLQTAAQPNINSVNVLDIANHNGSTAGLTLGGTLITATAAQINYINVSPGTAAAASALVLDSSRDITNIHSLTASQLTGTLQTAAQPNITSLGTLSGLTMDGSLTGLNSLSLDTTTSGRTLVVNDSVGNCLQLCYNTSSGSASTYADLLVSSAGDLSITPSGGNVNLTTHNGSTHGLKLGGTLVVASADQINYLSGTTPGNASNGKALIFDSSRNIANINNLTASQLTGTLQTAAQPNINSVNVLNVANHNGSTIGLSLNGTLITASATEINYIDAVPGSAAATKALVLDSSKNISGINSLSATDLTGQLQTASQPNITSVSVLDIADHNGSTQGLRLAGVLITATASQINSIFTGGGGSGSFGAITVDNNITITGADSNTKGLILGSTLVTSTGAELNYLHGVSAGSTSAGLALVTDGNNSIGNINELSSYSLSASYIYGPLQTAYQPNITAVGTLNGLSIATGESLSIGTSTYSQTDLDKILGITDGTAAADKALVLNSSGNISGINSLSATNLTGTLQTAAQTNITSLGTLTGLSISSGNTLSIGASTYAKADLDKILGITDGTAAADKALVLDSSRDITNIHSLSATNLTGTLQTAAQPNITSLGALTGLSVGSSSYAQADLDKILGITDGTAAADKALVLDSSRDITNIHSLSATNLTGTLQTAAQSNITSLGALTGLTVSGTTNSTDLITSGTAANTILNNWTYQSTLASNKWSAIAYSPSLKVFVAVANNSSGTVLVRSTDGINWTNISNPVSGAAYSDIVWVEDYKAFVSFTYTAGASNVSVIWSSDGTNWNTVAQAVDNRVSEITYVKETGYTIFTMAKDTAVTDHQFAIYTFASDVQGDSFNANSNTVNSMCINKIIYSAKWLRYYALEYVSGGSTTVHIEYSPDLAGWHTQGTSVTVSSFGHAKVFNCLCEGFEIGTMIGVAADTTTATGSVIYTTDGSTWINANAASASSWFKAVWAAELGLFIVISNDSTPAMMTSKDGITWTSVTLPGSWTKLNDIRWFPEISTLSLVSNVSGSSYAIPQSYFTGTTSINYLTNPNYSSVSVNTSANAMLNVNMGLSACRWLANTTTNSPREVMRACNTGLSINANQNAVAALDIQASTLKGNNKVLRLKASDLGWCYDYTFNPTTGALTTAFVGGMNYGNNTNTSTLTMAHTLAITGPMASSSTTTGSLTVSGGIGLTGALYSGGIINVGSTTAATSSTTGSLIIGGGAGIAGALYTGGIINVGSSTASTTSTTGALIVSGGIGIGGNSTFGGTITTTNGPIGFVHSYSSATMETYYDSGNSRMCLGTTTNNGMALFVNNSYNSPAIAISNTGVVQMNNNANLYGSSTNISFANITLAKYIYQPIFSPQNFGVNKELINIQTGTTNPWSKPTNNSDWYYDQAFTITNLSTSQVQRFSAYVSPTFTETFTYSVITTGMYYAVWVDGILQTSNFTNTGSLTNTFTIASTSGVYQSFYVQVWPKVSSNSFDIKWQSTSQSFGAVAHSSVWTRSTQYEVCSLGFSAANNLTVYSPNSSDNANMSLVSGNLTITSSGLTTTIGSTNNFNISGHNGSTLGLMLGGVLVSATAAQINYTAATPGTASASKALILDSSRDITNIHSLTATNLTGTLQTASQPNITSLGTLTGLTIGSGNTLSIGTSTYAQADLDKITGITNGAASASKALVLDSSSNISGINSLSATSLTATNLTGTLQTASQPNITSLGTLTGLTIGSGDTLSIGTSTYAQADLDKITGITDGTAAADKALVLDSSSNISGINSLSATNLTGTLQTAAQTNITSLGSLTGLAINSGNTLSIGTSTYAQADFDKILGITNGTGAADKALVLDSSRDITNIHSLTATNLTGTLQTAAQTNITSLGSLDGLTISTGHTLTIGSTVISESAVAALGGVTPGTVSASKVLIVDSSKNISELNNLGTTTIAVGSPANSTLPVEIGYTSYQFTGAYAYNNDINAHGMIDAGAGITANYSLRADGRILVTGEVEITSDRRLKKDIVELSADVAKNFIYTTTPVKFNWRSDDAIPDYGYIAQDVLKAGFDDLVTVVPHPGMQGSVDDDGFINPANAKYVFSPGKIIPMLALNQKKIFEAQDAKDVEIADLKDRVAALEALVQQLLQK